MHIALKKIEFELGRFLSKGSDEQVESIYSLTKQEYDLRKKELSKIDNKNNEGTEKKSVKSKKEETK